jgi:ABC-2 type transport system ATP-binding protein
VTPAIELTDVAVAYRLPLVPQRSLKKLPTTLFHKRLHHEPLWALRDVSLTVPRGEIVAVVGPNGAGKSTLLRLLARVFRPSEGRVVVRGTIAPLIDLGSGLDLAATARENVVLYGALLGRRPRTMRAEAAGILEWAGLSEFANVPVGVFSSGMIGRLAFAIATSSSPQVMLIDEVLGVGDASFQERSRERLLELAESGCTAVIVSHAPELLISLASRGVFLDQGRVRADGEVSDVLGAYLASPPHPITSHRDVT